MYRCILPSICIVLAALNFGQCLESRDRTDVAKNQTSALADRIWVSQLFALASQQFDLNAEQNAQCKRDYDLYQLHTRNQSIWAIRSKFFR